MLVRRHDGLASRMSLGAGRESGNTPLPAVMCAFALLAIIAAIAHTDAPPEIGLIALTCNEIRRLLVTFVVETARTLACPLAWSRSRRRHQHHAEPATINVRRPPTGAPHNVPRLEY